MLGFSLPLLSNKQGTSFQKPRACNHGLTLPEQCALSCALEEIRLNELLETEGFEVVESDLGEFIVQLRDEPPYHIVHLGSSV